MKVTFVIGALDRPGLNTSNLFRTQNSQNSEIVYLTLNLQIHAIHQLNNSIISIGAWEKSIKTK